LTSGRRLIGLIFVVAYYFFMVMRPMSGAYGRRSGFPTNMTFDLPPLQVLHAFVFAAFGFFTLLLALSTSMQRLSFRPADVDVLFATPLSPRIVLVFRLVRDYLFTLLMPLLFVLIGWRPTAAGVTTLIRNLPNPDSAGYVFRALSIAWILVALCWVSIGYALSLFINRSDLISDRNRRVITGAGVVLFLSVAAYIAWRVSSTHGWAGFVALARDPVLEIVFFTATAATTMVMAPLQGSWGPFFIAAFGLLALTGAAIAVAMTQVGWMYDQAAARGFDSFKIRKMQQSGDLVAVAEERARSGKVKARSWSWLMRVKATGPIAILWRELIIQTRAAPLLIIMFTAIGVLFGIMPIFNQNHDIVQDGTLFLSMQTMSVFLASMVVAQSGFIEVLRRVDLEKPLPFKPTTICFSEIAAKAMPATLSIVLAAIVCVVLRPDLWPYCLASLAGLPLLAILFCSVVFLVTVLFPDVDDPTQRGFRGLMILLGLAIVLAPVILLGGGIMFVMRSSLLGPFFGAAFGGGLALAISFLLALIAGGLYAQFNPSE
jgi:hypothetical protein